MSEYIVEFGYEPNVGNSSGMPIGERIVRCRDCEYLAPFPIPPWCGRYEMDVESDGFCAWAERKEGGDD